MIVKIFLSIMLILVQIAVPQSLKLLQTLGSSSDDAVQDLKFDRQGNLYIVGERRAGNDSSIMLSSSLSLRFGTTKTRSFIAKFDSTATEFKGIIVADSGRRFASIDIDSQGSIYATGSLDRWYGSLYKKKSWNSPYSGDFFVAKYDNNLEPVWSINSKSGGAFGTDIKSDTNGCVFCGTYCVPTSLQTFSISTPAGQCCDNMHSNSNAFIGRIDANGKCVFFRSAGKGLVGTRRMDVSSSGEIFLTGYACLFMPPETDSSNITGAGPVSYICGNPRGFLSKYSSDGKFQWVRQSQNKDTVSDCNTITINSKTNEIATNITFTSSGDPIGLSSSPYASSYTNWFSPAGVFLRSCSFGAGSRIADLWYDKNEQLCFAGRYTGLIIIGDDTLRASGAPGIQDYNMGFVGCFLPNGELKCFFDLRWKQEGDSGRSKISFNRFASRGERIFATGVYSKIITKDSTVTSRGGNDIYIAQINPDHPTGSAPNHAADVSMADWKISLQHGSICVQGKGKEELAISIYNFMGKRVFPSSGDYFVKPGKMIPVPGLANGFYFVRLASKNQILVRNILFAK